MSSKRVVITGMGWVTPLGAEVEGVWSRLLRGDSAIAPLSRYDARTFSTNFAAEVRDWSLDPALAEFAPEAHLNSRFTLGAAAAAWASAGLGDVRAGGGDAARRAGLDPSRVGMYLGAGEGTPDFENFVATNLAGWDAATEATDDARWIRAARLSMAHAREIEQEPNMVARHIADAFGARGPSFNCMTACAASTQATGEAAEILRHDDADVMLAGGSHSMIHPLGMTGFIRLTAMSTRRDDPAAAARPFDLSRDGFVMGEGAGVLVLETLEHARRRGAKPLAEVIGYGASADAYRITDIQPDGVGAAAAMHQAFEQAGIDPASPAPDGRPPVHYISAHGTGTKENDSIETRAVKRVFGEQAPRIPFSSVKSMFGHLIQAAGAVELITCIKAIHSGWVPPTINLRNPDPACDLDYVPNAARDMRPLGGVDICLSNSFGFGGQNNTIIVKRFTP